MLWMSIWATLTLLHPQWGVAKFWHFLGVWLIPGDVATWWFRLQESSDYIPHPYHMYTKCFSTLICCEWTYGSTLTPLCLCRSGMGFRKIGVGEPMSKWCFNVMVEAPNPHNSFHIHIGYIYYNVLKPWYAENGHMGPPLHHYTCAGQGWILGNLG